MRSYFARICHLSETPCASNTTSLTHERLANQQGLFLMQDSINSRFEDRMHSFVETIEVVEDDSFMSVSAKQVEDGIWKRLKSVCDARWNMKETFGFGLPRYLVAQDQC